LKPTLYKILSGSLLILVLLGYNQCIAPGGNATSSAVKFGVRSPGSINNGNGSVLTSEEVRKVSIEAFKQTVYPITRARCVSCHGVNQTPLHAVADVEAAHNSLVDTFKVDFNNIPNSRMVLKLKNDRHNCWGDCSSNASEMEAEITEWKKIIDEKAPETTTPVNNVTGKISKETGVINYYLDPDLQSATIMADSGSLTSPMVKGTLNGTSYIWAPEGTGIKTLTSTNAALSFHTITPPEAGIYKVYMLVQAPDANSDSIFVSVAGSAFVEWHMKTTTGFEWREVQSTTANLNSPFNIAGTSPITINLRQRDDGVKVSKIFITSNPNHNPALPNVTKATIKLPIAELTGIANSTFEIDVEEYDSYSYSLSNPRIKSTTNLFVKNLKVLVNGSYNPQHSTYTIIDKKITTADTLLSPYKMILLKDRGGDNDKLSFAFEHIGIDVAPVETPPVTPPTTTPPVTKLSSVEGFKQTLWPVLRARCISCHGETQPPLHAHANVEIAHTNVIESSLVNFSTVTSSKISNKLKVNRHNCWGDCDANAAEVEGLINIWKNLSGK
jgi:hypothetical protein